MKKRHIPIISFNEVELDRKRPQVYKSLVEGISDAIKDNDSKIELCEVRNSNIYVTVDRRDWKLSLDKALEFYENKEEYEECSKIKNLIDKL